jgi:elongation factor Ts
VEIKAKDVSALREKTGAGMMDCKRALTEAGGDFKKAERILKEIGAAAAAKRMDRATTEGRVFSLIKGSRGGLLELTCETDFVARNKDFIALGGELIAKIVETGTDPKSPELTGRVAELIATVKENMSLRRAELITAGANEMLVTYIHGEGRIGVIVKAGVDKSELLVSEKVKNFVFDCALHIAAYNPAFLSEKAVDPAYLKEQEEIFTVQAKQLGKPENVTAGIVKGKIKKHLSEVCLLEQPFVKDDKRSVAKAAQDTGTEAGGTVSIVQYLYYKVGQEL